MLSLGVVSVGDVVKLGLVGKYSKELAEKLLPPPHCSIGQADGFIPDNIPL